MFRWQESLSFRCPTLATRTRPSVTGWSSCDIRKFPYRCDSQWCSLLGLMRVKPRWTCPVGSAGDFKGLWSPCDFQQKWCFFFFYWPATFTSSYFPQVGDIIGLSQLGMDIMVSNDITLYIYIYMRCCDTIIHICK